VVDRVLELGKNLTERGLDAGPHTLVWHLEREQIIVSPATISRILTRHGAVIPDPSKRPKSSYRRFEAELPNQLWQSDFTHWTLADGTDVEILN
jgi:transposase InsO family protein